MTWLLVLVLAAAAFALMALALKAPRSGWTAIGAALLAGLAGYAAHANADLDGAPPKPRQEVAVDGAALVEARRRMSGESGPGSRQMVIADAMARHGDFAAAAEVLRGAVADNPRDGAAWLAMANALVAHADNRVSPAALHAFNKAQAAAPGSPAPPFFLGLALAQSGQVSQGRAMWAELLARSPAEAPWRAELAERLAQLDAFIAERAMAGISAR